MPTTQMKHGDAIEGASYLGEEQEASNSRGVDVAVITGKGDGHVATP
jgi:hypothetical protein